MLSRRWVLGGGAALAACGRPAAQEPPAPQLRLASPRAAHAAVAMPDGAVLFIGGCVLGGCEIGPASAVVERFDPRTRRLTAVGQLSSARIPEAVAMRDGRVLVAGGWTGGRPPSAAVEVFDPSRGESRLVGELAEGRAGQAMVALADGRVLIAGGEAGRTRLAIAEVFDPAGGRLARVGDLVQPRSGPTATRLADGRVLIVGGYVQGEAGSRPTATAEIFDPRTGRFTATGSLAQPRYKHAAHRLSDGRVAIVGGADERDYGGKTTRVEVYDPRTGGFSPAGETLEARFKIREAVVGLPGDRLLIAGGAARPEIFDVRTGRARPVDFAIGRSLNYATATRLPGGDVLLAGGYVERRIEPIDQLWIIPAALLA